MRTDKLQRLYEKAEKARIAFEESLSILGKEACNFCECEVIATAFEGDGIGIVPIDEDNGCSFKHFIALIPPKGKISEEILIKNSFL